MKLGTWKINIKWAKYCGGTWRNAYGLLIERRGAVDLVLLEIIGGVE